MAKNRDTASDPGPSWVDIQNEPSSLERFVAFRLLLRTILIVAGAAFLAVVSLIVSWMRQAPIPFSDWQLLGGAGCFLCIIALVSVQLVVIAQKVREREQ